MLLFDTRPSPKEVDSIFEAIESIEERPYVFLAFYITLGSALPHTKKYLLCERSYSSLIYIDTLLKRIGVAYQNYYPLPYGSCSELVTLAPTTITERAS